MRNSVSALSHKKYCRHFDFRSDLDFGWKWVIWNLMRNLIIMQSDCNRLNDDDE